MIRRPPRSTLTDTLLPSTTLFRSADMQREGRDIVSLAAGEPDFDTPRHVRDAAIRARSEEHTSELQSLMRISYAVLCLNKNTDEETYDRHKLITNREM